MEQALTLSDEAYEQATIYELGKPVSEYPSQTDTEKMKKGMSVIRLAFFLVWILITAICVGLAALIYFLSQPTLYSPDLSAHFMGPGLFIFVAVSQTVFIFRAIRLIVKKLVVCTGGILTLRGSNLEATTWEQITTIQREVTETRTRFSSGKPIITYRLKRSNGSTLTLDAIRGAQVEEHYIEACLPALLAQYKSGTPLTFGKLSLDSTGITWQARILPWHEFEEVRIVQNPSRLSIFQRGHGKAWTVLRSQNVPSLALVGRVIEQIRAKQECIKEADQNPDLPKSRRI